MMRYLLITILMAVVHPGTAQTKIFELLDVSIQSDIDKNQFLDMKDHLPDTSLLSTIFSPVKGKYKVYRFLSTYTGISMNNDEKKFHDCILLKTDDHEKILEAYLYNIELYNPPSWKAIYKSTTPNLLLKDKIDILIFKFTRKNYDDTYDRILKDHGVIHLTSNRAKFI